jgi:hypothetical protein
MSPDKLRHDVSTFQVPTRVPPHEVPLGQLGLVVEPPLPPLAVPPLLLPDVPPELDEPPALPPLPVVPPELGLELLPPQPATSIHARAATLARPTSPFRMRPPEALSTPRQRFSLAISQDSAPPRSAAQRRA